MAGRLRSNTNILWANVPHSEYLLDLYSGLALWLVRARGKRPVDAGWPRLPEDRWSARTSPEEVADEMAAWLNADDAHQIGLAVPRGAIVLDADTREHAQQLEELAPLDTPVQITACGAHLVFRVPPHLEIPATCRLELGDDLLVDVRPGGRSQIIVEPSLHSELGTPYVWSSRLPRTLRELPALPRAWIEHIARPRSSRGPCSLVAQDARLAHGSPIVEGERNAQLFSRGCAMQARALSDAAIRAALHAENAACARPPLPEREVAQIAASVLRYPKGVQP